MDDFATFFIAGRCIPAWLSETASWVHSCALSWSQYGAALVVRVWMRLLWPRYKPLYFAFVCGCCAWWAGFGAAMHCNIILLWYKAVGLDTGQSHYAIQWLLWLIFNENICCRSGDYCSDADFCYHRVAPKPQHIAEVGIIVITVRNLSFLDRPVELRYKQES